MIRCCLVAFVMLAVSNSAFGHFVYVVFDKDGKTISVVMSETLEPDDAVSLGPVVGLKLSARGADGKESPVALTPHEHHLTGKSPSQHVVFGSLDYGVSGRGDKPFMLRYHPKAIVGVTP